MEIESIRLRNIGKFEDKRLEFDSEDTVVYGPNASGKSTVIRALKSFFSDEESDIINNKSDSGRIEVETSSSRGELTLNEAKSPQGNCLVIDELLPQLSSEKTEEAIRELKDQHAEQIILTSIRQDVSEMFENQIKLTSINESRLEELRHKLSEIEEGLSEAKTRYENLQEHKQDLDATYKKKVAEKTKAAEMKENLKHLNEEIDSTQEVISEKEARIASVEEKIEQTDDEREKGRLEERRDTITQEIGDLKDQLETMEDEKAQLEGSLAGEDALGSELEKLEHDRDRTGSEISEVRDEITDLRQRKTEVKSEIKKVESKL